MTAETVTTLMPVLDELDYANSPGLVRASTLDQMPTDVRFRWDELGDRAGVDAVFFHESTPLVAFTSAVASDLRELRKRLWNYGRLPLLVVASIDGEVSVYNALSGPSRGSDTYAAPLLTSRRGHIRRDLASISRSQVQSGQFAREFHTEFSRSDTVDAALLENLRYLRDHLPERTDQRLNALDSVIGASLLATYLQDRGVLTEEHVSELSGRSTIMEVLHSGMDSTRLLFGGLAARFNGDVFGPVNDHIQHLSDTDLAMVGYLLNGNQLETGQAALWPYDFSLIPPDLVSRIYETLLEGDREKHASYYTPREVVSLVLDEVLPLDGSPSNTVADLACGSGAFITEAFRRIAFMESRQRGALPYDSLASILQERIYGVDLNDTAVRVSIFGLYLALLEHVEPRTIWETAVLPPLYGQNLITADAFSGHSLSGRTFDVIVSNPPWKSALTTPAVSFVSKGRYHVGDQQSAQAFLWLAWSLLAPTGRLGFVMPAKSLLYNRSKPNREFRDAVFRVMSVRTVVDMSPVRRRLFRGAISPTAVIVADKPGEESKDPVPVLHISIHPRPMMSVVDALVVAPEDVTAVPRRLAERPDIWKSLLWGSLRDIELLDELSVRCHRLEEVAKARGWRWGQGFKEGGPQRDASDLVGLPIISPNSIARLVPVPLPEERLVRSTLHRRLARDFYGGTKVLIGRTLDSMRIAATLVEYDALFSSNMTCFRADHSRRGEMQFLALVATSSLIQYWQFLRSASWGVERPTVETNEIREWPFIDPSESILREAAALWAALPPTGPTEEDDRTIDSFVFDVYGLSKRQRERVLSGVELSLKTESPASLQFLEVTSERLETYSAALRSHLSSGFSSLSVNVASDRQGSLVGVKVSFARGPSSSSRIRGWRETDWQRIRGSLAGISRTSAVVAEPSLVLFDDDRVFLVKTADFDRWSFDSALDDGDRVFSALAFGMADAH